MATPGDLIEVMADALGVPQRTVFQYDRSLAEHGLRSKKGRGPSAATVTARDAANLLIAAMATPVSGLSIKDAARACQSYMSLRAGLRSNEESKPTPRWLIRSNLPREHSFGDALAVLIDNCGRDNVWKASKPKVDRLSLKVSLEGPRPMAEIVYIASPDEFASQNSLNGRRLVYGGRKRAHRDHAALDETFGDLTLRGSITLFTIQALGSLLKDEREAR